MRGTAPLSARRRWRTLIVAAVIAVVGVTLGVGLGRDPSVVPSALVHRTAPALAGPALGGGRIDLRTYRGSYVLVNVWASWCAACRGEYPVLRDTQARFGPQRLKLVGIDMRDRPQSARAFLAGFDGPRWPSVLDPDAQLAVRWGTFALPETYVVDPHGRIVDKATGPVSARWIAEHVATRLNLP